MNTTYESLGVRPVINAFATLTRLGGSRMAPEVLAAMQQAAGCFVDLEELQNRVGERLAVLTKNEAAYVSSGAAAGLALATAACVVGAKPDLGQRQVFPHLKGLRNQVIVQRSQRNGFVYAIRQTGVEVLEIGDELGTPAKALREAIGPQTACIFWFQGAMNSPLELPLPEVIRVAKEHGVPVIVDAAAQLPPVSNLWHFTKLGAALAIFSGGKELAGPQSSGLVVGRQDLIEAIRLHGNPHPTVGRPMKVGKEEMMGLLAAVERYIGLDHQADRLRFERIVAHWNDGLAQLKGTTARRDFPNEAGQPTPRTLVQLSPNFVRDDVIHQLWRGNPAIAVAPADGNGIYLNPTTLNESEAEVVLRRLLEVLKGP